MARANEEAVGLTFALPPAQQQSQSLPKAIVSSEIADIQNLVRPEESLPPLTKDVAATSIEQESEKEQYSGEKEIPSLQPSPEAADEIGLSFAKSEEDLLAVESTPVEGADTAIAPIPAEVADSAQGLEDWIFEGGTDSLVARTVGNAEGTRAWNGEKTPAYYGHIDPGNGVWNRGTFSYQHEARSPEDADDKQLQRLKLQGLQLEEQAQKQGLKLTLEERLNGIDLANQAPLAALDRGGYIEQLAKARRLSMEDFDAIVWARTQAYLDPDTRQWNAPGLGNNVYSIDRDQRRRAAAIAQAHEAYTLTGTEKSAQSSLNNIHLTESAPEPSTLVASSSELSFTLPPVTTALLKPLREQLAAEPPEVSTPNPPSASPLENPDLGIHFSTTDDADMMAGVQAASEDSLEATALPTVPESLATSNVTAEPFTPDVTSTAIASPPQLTHEVAGYEDEPATIDRDQATASNDRPASRRLAPLAVPPVAPPIATSQSMADAPQNVLARKDFWRYEDKVGDDSVDKTELATPAEK